MASRREEKIVKSLNEKNRHQSLLRFQSERGRKAKTVKEEKLLVVVVMAWKTLELIFVFACYST